MKNNDIKIIKKNIVNELSLCHNHSTTLNLAYHGTNTYVRGYFTLLALKNKVDKKDFTQFYIRLLKIRSFPVLPLDKVLSLSENYKRNPDLYEQIKYFSSLTPSLELPKNTWEDVIYALSRINRPDCILNKIKILGDIMTANRDLIGSYNIHEFCKDLFLLYDQKTDLLIQGRSCNLVRSRDGFYHFENDKDLNSVFGLLIYWTNKIIRNGVNVHDNLNQLIKLRFSNHKNWVEWTPELKEFLDFIEEKLPPNFLMLRYRLLDIEKLSKLYHLRKDIFLNAAVNSDELTGSKFILEAFFKKFVIPKVFFMQFFQLDDSKQNLLEFILKGGSIRNFAGLPLKMDKKACHFLRNQNVNESLNFWSYFVIAKLESEGVNRNYALKVCEIIDRSGGHYDFWIDNLLILYRKGLNERSVESVSDYIHSKVIFDGGSIDFKRIALKTLIERSDQWHIVNRFNKQPNKKLPVSVINSFEYSQEGIDENYVIKQLTTTLELFKEGSNLHHCVYTYSQACLSQRSYIFSLRLKEEFTETPLITIEVSQNKIVQAKGNYNRAANKMERSIIEMWAEQEKLFYKRAA